MSRHLTAMAVALLAAVACDGPTAPEGTVPVRVSLPVDAPAASGPTPFLVYIWHESGLTEICRFTLPAGWRGGTLRLPAQATRTEAAITEPVREARIGFLALFDLGPETDLVQVQLMWTQHEFDPSFPIEDRPLDPFCPETRVSE